MIADVIGSLIGGLIADVVKSVTVRRKNDDGLYGGGADPQNRGKKLRGRTLLFSITKTKDRGQTVGSFDLRTG